MLLATFFCHSKLLHIKSEIVNKNNLIYITNIDRVLTDLNIVINSKIIVYKYAEVLIL